MRVLLTKWQRKPAGIDMEWNYVTVTLCIPALPLYISSLSFLLSHFLPLLSLPLPLFLPFPHKSSRKIWGSTVNSPSRSGHGKAKWFLEHSDTETKQFCTCVLVHFDMLLHAEFSDACGTKITASHPLVLAVGAIAPMELARMLQAFVTTMIIN